MNGHKSLQMVKQQIVMNCDAACGSCTLLLQDILLCSLFSSSLPALYNGKSESNTVALTQVRLETELRLLFLMLELLPYLIVFIDMPIHLLNCFRRHRSTILELIHISSPQINILWSRIENNFLICNFPLSVFSY